MVLPDASDRSFAERKIEIFDRLYGIELENNVSVSPLVVLKSIWERMRTPFTINDFMMDRLSEEHRINLIRYRIQRAADTLEEATIMLKVNITEREGWTSHMGRLS